MTKKNFFKYIFSYFCCSFIYIKHFYLAENIYARNFYVLLLVYYWTISSLLFLCVFLPLKITKNKDYETWFEISQDLSTGKKLLKIAGYVIIAGFAVIGEWEVFIPVSIGQIFYEILRMRIRPLVEEYRKTNNVEPVPVKNPKLHNRYELVKKKRHSGR